MIFIGFVQYSKVCRVTWQLKECYRILHNLGIKPFYEMLSSIIFFFSLPSCFWQNHKMGGTEDDNVVLFTCSKVSAFHIFNWLPLDRIIFA